MSQPGSQSLFAQRSRVLLALVAVAGALLPAFGVVASGQAPEAASMLLFGGGLLGLAATVRRSPLHRR
jgi:hypothetical protein